MKALYCGALATFMAIAGFTQAQSAKKDQVMTQPGRS